MKRPLIVRFKGNPGVAHRLQWGFYALCPMDVIQSDVIEEVLFYQVWTPNHKKLWLQHDEVEVINFHQLSKKEQKAWNERQMSRLLSLDEIEKKKAIDHFFQLINKED